MVYLRSVCSLLWLASFVKACPVNQKLKPDVGEYEFYSAKEDDTNTDIILDINKPLLLPGGLLVQGDIIKDDVSVRAVGKWSKVGEEVIVPYELSSLYAEEDVKILQEAFEGLQRETCIRFVRRTNEKSCLSIQPLQG
ncbi:high choriolytic enzyme 2-like [Protopterus annectens]|uniref:high choriolytic enzyme 2-like n=1 Tax=Protopterus annectens TaxID=7888 RepID=UPI001CF95739|nr:high choriolytic enzyme 2-like [Protopterus annectens]